MTYKMPFALYAGKNEEKNPCRWIETSKTCQKKMTEKAELWKTFLFCLMGYVFFLKAIKTRI